MLPVDHPRLYVRDSLGVIRVWYIQEDTSVGRFRTLNGVDGGSLVTSEWTQCTPKNPGKKNETTPHQQCAKEIASLYVKKKKQGYHENISELEGPKAFFKPMLAHDYRPYRRTLRYPVYSQPKLDGVRCIGTSDGLWTRNGERITALGDIESRVIAVCRLFEITLDGELYTSELSFNEIVGAVRKQTYLGNLPLEYWVYDVLKDPGEDFKTRLALKESLRPFLEVEPIKILKTSLCRSPTELDSLMGRYVSEGYEGQMIRIPGFPYEQKRSKGLLKRKEFMDAEFEILKVNEGLGNRSGMASTVTCKTADSGVLFEATLTGGVENYRTIWKNKENYIGKLATVKFFEYTPKGVPRFPVVKSIHLDNKI